MKQNYINPSHYASCYPFGEFMVEWYCGVGAANCNNQRPVKLPWYHFEEEVTWQGQLIGHTLDTNLIVNSWSYYLLYYSNIHLLSSSNYLCSIKDIGLVKHLNFSKFHNRNKFKKINFSVCVCIQAVKKDYANRVKNSKLIEKWW